MELKGTPKTLLSPLTFIKEGKPPEIRAELPEFEFQPFGINEDLQQVVRKPTLEEPRAVPVGVVSLAYNLVQHTQVIDWMFEGISAVCLPEYFYRSRLYLSHYGERMLLWTTLREKEFDPGDGFPLQAVLICQNSVEKSRPLEVSLLRLREECSNGIILGFTKAMRKMYDQQRFNPVSFSYAVRSRLEMIREENRILSKWLTIRITERMIDLWVDQAVEKMWGLSEAARVGSICRDGWDGDIYRIKYTVPSRLQVSWMDRVPGACVPVGNIYHAAQALGWIASKQPVLEDRLIKMRQIPEMIEELLKIRSSNFS
jgi:hypothetical protein